MLRLFKNLICDSVYVLRNHGIYEFLKRVKDYPNKLAIRLLPNTYLVYKLRSRRNREPARAAKEKYRVMNLAGHPKFIIILNISNQKSRLIACIQSIKDQLYPKWELLLDNKNNEHIDTKIKKIMDVDSRVKLINTYLPSNLFDDNDKNNNQEQYHLLLGSPGKMASDALDNLARVIIRYPGVDMIYCDEDHLGIMDVRIHPLFYPDYSPTLFLNVFMDIGLLVYRSAFLKSFYFHDVNNVNYYDLALRASEKAMLILHIPRILYHKYRRARNWLGTVACSDYCQQHGKILKMALTRRGINAEIESNMNINQIRRTIPEQPCVTIIIPIRDRIELLEKLIDSFYKYQTYSNYKIMIFNNDSIEKRTGNYLKKITDGNHSITVIDYKHPFNYAAMMNLGVESAESELILLLNNDTEIIHKYWMEPMISYAMEKDVGAVGAMLLYADKLIQHLGVGMGVKGCVAHLLAKNREKNINKVPGKRFYLYDREVSAVTGACLMIQKSLYLQVGGMDSVNFKVAFNDIDLCLKLRALNYRILMSASTRLIHHESKSRGRKEYQSEVDHFISKWAPEKYYDPYININYSKYGCNLAPGQPWELPEDGSLPYVYHYRQIH